VTTRDVVACDLAVTEPGRYWLGATALDAKGRPISAAQLVYVQGGRPPPPPPPTKPNPEPPPPPPALSFDEECRLPPRKDQYPDLITIEGGDSYRRTFAVGDKAHLCLRGHGDTLFTLEREGVLRHEVRRLSDRGTLVDVVITPELFPNVTVALHTVSGRDGAFPATSGARARSDDGHPSSGSRSIGLRVVWPEKKLTVALVTAPELRPGADAVVDVSVKDGAGRPTPAQVTLWAVDEGAVLLRPFTVPDLDRVFAEERGSDVRVTDTRDQLFWERVGMHQTKAPSLRQGMTSTGHALLIDHSTFHPTT
jgi:hypothetical protein